MVDFDQVPPGEMGLSRVGLSHCIWWAGFLIICSLVPLLSLPGNTPVISTLPEEKNWLYRRETVNSSVQDPSLEILVVGDVMLGRGVAEVADPFGEIQPLLAAADLTVGNYEGVISNLEVAAYSEEDQSGSTPYRLVATGGAAGELQAAGFDLLSLANNHSLDLGQSGLQDTIGRLARVGIKVAWSWEDSRNRLSTGNRGCKRDQGCIPGGRCGA